MLRPVPADTSDHSTSSSPRPHSGGSTAIQNCCGMPAARSRLGGAAALGLAAPVPVPAPAATFSIALRVPAPPVSNPASKTALAIAISCLAGRSGPDLETVGILGRLLAVPDHAVDELAGAHRVFGRRNLHRAGHGPIQLDLVDLPGHAQVVGVLLEQAPAFVLGEEPHAVRQIGKVHRAIVEELHVVGVVPGLAQTVLIAAQNAL